MKRKLNIGEKNILKSEALSRFVRQYARKAQKGHEPNDRQYDRKLEEHIKKMTPEALDALLRLGSDDGDKV